MTVYPAEMPLDWPWIALIAGAVLLVGLVVMRPGTIVRGFLWLVTHTLYRLHVTGLENVPSTGPALLVCNHVSYIDWLLLRAALPRRVRFLVWAPYAKRFGIRHLIRWTPA